LGRSLLWGGSLQFHYEYSLQIITFVGMCRACNKAGFFDMSSLAEKVGLVVGIANEQSIAWGCAKAFRGAGAQLAITYLNARAEPHVRVLAEKLDAPIIVPLEVTDTAQMDATFAAIDRKWGRLDFLLHSIA